MDWSLLIFQKGYLFYEPQIGIELEQAVTRFWYMPTPPRFPDLLQLLEQVRELMRLPRER